MEPQTRYVRTADGVNIATQRFDVGGTGVPLVIAAPYAMSSFSIDWGVPDYRAGITVLAQDRPVISYDPRGYGLSDHDVTNFGLDARVADLAAVVDSVGPRVNILSRGPGCFQALAYAARNPDHVARLILSDGIVRGRDFHLNADCRALTALIETNFELYLQTVVLADFGWDDGKVLARDIARHVTKQSLQAAFAATRDIDVSGELPHVACPALVVNGRWQDTVPSEAVRRLAAMLPDARLVELDYVSRTIFHHRPEEHAGVFAAFLAEGDARKRAPDVNTPRAGTTVILFTDIVDSTALTERLGDAAFRDRARALDAELRAVIARGGGVAIEGKLLGDGVLATFPSAAQAIAAARGCHALNDRSDLRLHIGIHAGDVIREDDNLFGGAVNIAARICGLSAPGETLVSTTVRDLARTSAGVEFEDRGEQDMKGVAEPVRLYAVRMQPA